MPESITVNLEWFTTVNNLISSVANLSTQLSSELAKVQELVHTPSFQMSPQKRVRTDEDVDMQEAAPAAQQKKPLLEAMKTYVKYENFSFNMPSKHFPVVFFVPDPSEPFFRYKIVGAKTYEEQVLATQGNQRVKQLVVHDVSEYHWDEPHPEWQQLLPQVLVKLASPLSGEKLDNLLRKILLCLMPTATVMHRVGEPLVHGTPYTNTQEKDIIVALHRLATSHLHWEDQNLLPWRETFLSTISSRFSFYPSVKNPKRALPSLASYHANSLWLLYYFVYMFKPIFKLDTTYDMSALDMKPYQGTDVYNHWRMCILREMQGSSIAHPSKVFNLNEVKLCSDEVDVKVHGYVIQDDAYGNGGLPWIFTVKTVDYENSMTLMSQVVTATVFDPLWFVQRCILANGSKISTPRVDSFPDIFPDMILPNVLSDSRKHFTSVTDFHLTLRECLNSILLCFYAAVKVEEDSGNGNKKVLTCTNNLHLQAHRNITVALHALYQTSLTYVSEDESSETSVMIKQAWKHFVNNIVAHHSVKAIGQDTAPVMYTYVFFDVLIVLSKFIAIANTSTIPLNHILPCHLTRTQEQSLHSRDNYYHIKNLSMIAEGTQGSTSPSFFPHLKTMTTMCSYAEYNKLDNLRDVFTYYNIFEEFVRRVVATQQLTYFAKDVREVVASYAKSLMSTPDKTVVTQLYLSFRMIHALCQVPTTSVKSDLVPMLEDFAKMLSHATFFKDVDLKLVLQNIHVLFADLVEFASRHAENEYVMTTLSCALSNVAKTSSNQATKVFMMYLAWCPRNYCNVGEEWFIDAAKYHCNTESLACDLIYLRSFLMAVCRHYPEMFIVDSNDRAKLICNLYESFDKVKDNRFFKALLSPQECTQASMVFAQVDIDVPWIHSWKGFDKHNMAFAELVRVCKRSENMSYEDFAKDYKLIYGEDVHNDGWKNRRVFTQPRTA
jgi:hypothetical protein